MGQPSKGLSSGCQGRKATDTWGVTEDQLETREPGGLVRSSEGVRRLSSKQQRWFLPRFWLQRPRCPSTVGALAPGRGDLGAALPGCFLSCWSDTEQVPEPLRASLAHL